MIRSGHRWIIFFKDLKNGLVRKENFTYKGQHYTEYYIYKVKKTKTGLFDARGKFILRKDDRPTLSALICCGASQSHIKKNLPDSLIVEGIKFTNDKYGNDINEYLRKTGRTLV